MKNPFFLLLLAILLAGCGAQARSLPAAPTSAPLVLPQATEKVVVMVTATGPAQPKTPPTLTATLAAIPNQTATAPGKVFESAAGNLVFRQAKFVEEVHGMRPDPGCKILLVFFERTDGAPMDVHLFHDAGLHFLVRGDDGSETSNPMGGLVDGGFALGFQVPQTAKTLQLVWPDQAVTDIPLP